MSDENQIVCPACAAVNRMPPDRPASAARCGRCGVALFTGAPVEADAAMFEAQVARSSVPVLVDVWAPWCGPCRVMAPAFARAAAELEPGVRLLKLNSDAEPATTARLGIRGIPALLLYAGGREIARSAGAMPADSITAWVRQQLARAA